MSCGVARVNKSDKVEAAGWKRRAVGKVQASVAHIGLSLIGLSKFEGSSDWSLAYKGSRFSVFWLWAAFLCVARLVLSQSPSSTGAVNIGLENGHKMGGSSCGLLSRWGSGTGYLPAPEGFDNAHLSAAVGACFAQ